MGNAWGALTVDECAALTLRDPFGSLSRSTRMRPQPTSIFRKIRTDRPVSVSGDAIFEWP